MNKDDDVTLIPVAIASQAATGNVATIPATQATAGDGRVSIDLGYPPECAISVAAGGKYPEMQDANGVYRLLSSAIRSSQSWGILPFDADFAAGIGGYPAGAIVAGSTVGLFWVSTADNNTTTPGATGATWTALLAGYLPLTGGILTGDTTIKGLASWSTTGNFVSLGLGFLGNNGTGASIRQNDITNQYTQLLFEVDGYNGVKRYFGMRDDGTFWCGGVQFADRTWANATFQPKGNYQAAGDYALNSRVSAYFAGAGSNAAVTNLQGVNWTAGNTSAYVQVTANGVSLALPTSDNVYNQITSYAQPKGNYQAAGDYVTSATYNSDFNTTSDNVINLPYQNREQVFTTTASAGDIVTFPVAFSSVQGCICHVQGNSDFNVKAFNVTNTGFTLHINGGGNNAPIVVYAKGKK